MRTVLHRLCTSFLTSPRRPQPSELDCLSGSLSLAADFDRLTVGPAAAARTPRGGDETELTELSSSSAQAAA